MRTEQAASKLEVLLEAARRANWDALRGPQHLKAGRFRPQPASSAVDHSDLEGEQAAQPGVADACKQCKQE
jgi:hypothetical protein